MHGPAAVDMVNGLSAGTLCRAMIGPSSRAPTISHCYGPAEEAGIAGLESLSDAGAELGLTRMVIAALAFPLLGGLRHLPCLPGLSFPAWGSCVFFRFRLEDDRCWSLEGTGMALVPP